MIAWSLWIIGGLSIGVTGSIGGDAFVMMENRTLGSASTFIGMASVARNCGTSSIVERADRKMDG